MDILVATPGRLLDLIKQKHVNMDFIETVVLDESDTMLDMGFINDVKKILAKVPQNHQTLLFSATMPTEIKKLALELLKNHVTIKIDLVSSAAPNINQSLYFVDKSNKVNLLLDLFKKQKIESLLIFTRTKMGANKLSKALNEYKIPNEVIHGDKPQRARVAALKKFKSGQSNILIATDVAAHGIDIKGLSHVLNYDLPDQAETYVHRIGRTGRAGATGIAISFCDNSQRKNLKNIQGLLNKEIVVVYDHDYHVNEVITEKKSFNRNKSFSKKKNNYGRNKQKPNNNRNEHTKSFDRNDQNERNNNYSYKKNDANRYRKKSNSYGNKKTARKRPERSYK